MTDTSLPTVIIRATLPICLHLDSRVFRISNRGDTEILIATESVFSDEPTYLGTAKNAEIESDTFSHFRFTRVAITIPELTASTSDAMRILEMHKKTFFVSLNRFIDAARAALNRPGLRNYFDYSDFIEPVHAESSTEPSGLMTLSFAFPGGGLVPARPIRPPVQHSNLQNFLQSEMPLADRFMLDAKRDQYYQSYTYALLNAVIALEIVVSDTIRTIGGTKAIAPAEINKFIKDVGLTGSIKATIRLLCPPDLVLPDDAIFEKCKAAITLRNNVMHKGHRDVSERDVSDCIGSISTMVAFCERVEATYGKK